MRRRYLGLALLAASQDDMSQGLSVKHLPKTVRRLRYAPVVLMGIAALGMSLATFAAMREWEWQTIQGDLAVVAHTRVAAVEAELDVDEDIVDAIGSFFGASVQVGRANFEKFTTPFVADAPGLQAFAWAPCVVDAKRSQYESAARDDGLTGFQFTERHGSGGFVRAAQRAEYFPVSFAAPRRDNESLIGFDLGSRPELRKVLEHVRESGKSAVLTRFTIPHKPNATSGLLLLKPVYRSNDSTDTKAKRLECFQGFILGVLHVSGIVRKALSEFSDENVTMSFFDMTAPNEGRIFYSCRLRKDPDQTQTAREAPSVIGLSHTAEFPLQIGGGDWRLVLTPDAAFIADHRTWHPWMVLAAGLLLTIVNTLFLVVIVRRATRNERRIRNWADALQQSEERYRTLIENIDVGISLISHDYTILAVNRAQCRLFDKPADAMVGQKCYREYEKRDTPCDHCPGTRAMAAGQPAAVETQGVRDDGTRVDAQVQAFPMIQADGSIVGFVELVDDISQRLKVEQALKEHTIALEAANKDLERCSLEAQAATRAKSEFLANMSHELRTPLTAIIGFADLLLDALPISDERHSAATIRRNGEYLLSIINDILDLTKIEAGKLEMEHIPCSPRQILAELTSLMTVNADAKGISLTIGCDGPLPESIQSDPVRLRQILINLAGNAIKFTPTGEVSVKVRLLAEAGAEPKLQFDVIDTGIGMTEEQIERLFDPFAQADSSTTRRFGGTGLGLAISHRLAVMLGGRIAVHSEVGKGSVFSLTIATGPLDGVRLIDIAQDEAEAAGQAAVGSTTTKLACHVLLVEDGRDNQRLISLLLKKAGAEVTLAHNGREAVDKVLAQVAEDSDEQSGQRSFDVILMDIQMPIMDGYEATRRLRGAGFARPIIALTAHAMAQDIRQCEEAGCDAHLSKPIDREALLQTIARFVDASVSVR